MCVKPLRRLRVDELNSEHPETWLETTGSYADRKFLPKDHLHLLCVISVFLLDSS